MKAGDGEKQQARWARLGPYYAMFPYDYASQIVKTHTKPGEAVLDPFAGRFNSVVAASYAGRVGVGVEINPLGWLYGHVKINPAARFGILTHRLAEMAKLAGDYRSSTKQMGEFFNLCFSKETLSFLLACRENLNWKRRKADATLMAQILTSMHHQIGRGLSNQMRQTKSMSPDYSVRWWKANGFHRPPKIDPASFIRKRIEWRYKYGAPRDCASRAYYGDSTRVLDSIPTVQSRSGGVKLLFTSPPYYNMVDYHKDQWLRLWMLGGSPRPVGLAHKHKKRFSDAQAYESMLSLIFGKCARMMDRKSVIVVRTHAREYTARITRDILLQCFPDHKMEEKISQSSKSQSALFNRNLPLDNGKEKDFILRS